MYNDDEDFFVSDKFDDCSECKFKYCELTCSGCGMGEEFEPEDMEEVDAHFEGRF